MRMSGSFRPFRAQVDKLGCLSWSVEKSPCEAVCPLGIDIEKFLAAIAAGNFQSAADTIRERCPLPSICGRVCHHPCESECKRGKTDEPLAIMSLKRFAVEQAGRPETPEPPAGTRNREIAIIGSGPAGLTAAHDLAKAGHGVVIYEALPVPGGMMAAGIPEFMLPQAEVQADIACIKALGVEIRTNTRIGEKVSLKEIIDGHKAVLVTVGAWRSAPLPIPGIDLGNVLPAVDFLREAKIGEKPALSGKVVVIGGGNVAVDAARTALRLGAGEVHMYCLESRDIMPAFTWEIASAEAEGVKVHPSHAPQRLRGSNGKVSHVDFKTVAKFERQANGRLSWTLAEGPEADSSAEADYVIIAIGQRIVMPDLSGVGLELDGRGAIVADPQTLKTSVPGVYAAGDVLVVAGTLTEAMASGRKAAQAIEKYLAGENPDTVAAAKPPVTGKEQFPVGIPREERQKMPELPVVERVSSFAEVHQGFSREQAQKEAKRCLKCKTCLRCLNNWSCIAISLKEHDGKQSPSTCSLTCSGCGVCISQCPFDNLYRGDDM